ncbi:MAG: SDR family oxidoreductase [Bacteroidota bacterium]
MKNKIALLGATGQTGSILLEKALERGYTVKALVRNTHKITITHERLHIIQGDVLNLHDVEKLIQDTTVVVSLFGHVKDSPEWLQTNGTKNIVSAMQKEGIHKIISLSGGGLPFPEKDEPKFIDKMIRFVMKMAVPKILNDAIAHHKVLENSGLKWVIVRGPRLTNDPPKGTYRVGWVGVNSSTQIARGDLASFILQQVESDEFIDKMPFVSY